MSLNGVTLRPVEQQDEPFLRLLYATTRTEELALVDWDETQKQAFLNMQFSAQHRYYLEAYPDGEFLIIVRNCDAIGRLYVERRPGEIRIIDMSLLPDHRNRGVGTALLTGILQEAAAARKPARAHVEIYNHGSMRLCRRLGFSVVENRGMFDFIEWRAPEPNGQSCGGSGEPLYADK